MYSLVAGVRRVCRRGGCGGAGSGGVEVERDPRVCPGCASGRSHRRGGPAPDRSAGQICPRKYAQIGRDSCPPRRVLAHFDDPTQPPRSTTPHHAGAPSKTREKTAGSPRGDESDRDVLLFFAAHCYDRCCVASSGRRRRGRRARVAAVSDEPRRQRHHPRHGPAQRWRRAVGLGTGRRARARRRRSRTAARGAAPRRQEGRGIGVPTVLARGRPRRRPVARGARRGLCRRPGRAFRVPGNVSGGFVAHRARVGFERVRDRGRARAAPSTARRSGSPRRRGSSACAPLPRRVRGDRRGVRGDGAPRATRSRPACARRA